MLRGILLFCAFGALMGCLELNKKTPNNVVASEKPSCLNSVIEGEYIVTWEDGRITKEFGDDMETFKQGFISKNLANIRQVERNKMIYLDPMTKATQLPFVGGNDISNWQTIQTRADSAWQQGVEGNTVTVAVIDSGVDYEHPQLENQIAINIGETGTDGFGFDRAFNNIDDDENGFVDDVYGYNFVLDSNDPMDTGDHGTHVAGIIGAEHNDSVAKSEDYVQGMAPAAKIIPIAFISPLGGSLDDAISAIDYAVARNADIINASWGGATCSKTLGQKIQSLESLGVLFVAASGNSGNNIDVEPEYPAAYNLPLQVTVGAISEFETMTGFSNYGAQRVHIFAPGKDVASTVPNGGYRLMSGTSMATPVIAGALALLKSARPDASPHQLRQALLAGVDKDGTYRNISQGRLNVAKAIAEIMK